MKINEFLAEINMLPEAVHLLNELQESGRIGKEEYNVTALFDDVFTILEYIDSCETSSPIIYKKGRKGNDIKSGTAEYT